ncbi:MAG: ThiF family adenylyltransferase [Candidatus Omnitrophica bacterium]|nr:ThiF family adenylyltransferase [Candidatus Omnitrophota bacterium]
MDHGAFYRTMVERNIGVISAEEQERLRNTCIAVAGCGGIGGLSAEQLVRLGVGHVKIADFDHFEIHNLSRQSSSTTHTIGHPKVEVLARHFKAINPGLQIDTFNDGVHAENVEEFVRDAAIAIDGIDYNCFYNTVVLDRAARKEGICVLDPLAVGFGTSVLVFGPQTVSIEEYVGLRPGASREEIERFSIPIEKFAPYIPSYVNVGLARVAALAKINFPNIIMPQHLGTAVAVSEAVMILLGRVAAPKGPGPRVFTLDLQDRKFEVTG